jgi:hypothetical protein
VKVYHSDLSCYDSDCTTSMTLDKCRESKGLKRFTFKYRQQRQKNNNTFIKVINIAAVLYIYAHDGSFIKSHISQTTKVEHIQSSKWKSEFTGPNQYSDSQCCWKKYSDFGGGKKI